MLFCAYKFIRTEDETPVRGQEKGIIILENTKDSSLQWCDGEKRITWLEHEMIQGAIRALRGELAPRCVIPCGLLERID
jgi:hypothetical protein